MEDRFEQEHRTFAGLAHDTGCGEWGSFVFRTFVWRADYVAEPGTAMPPHDAG